MPCPVKICFVKSSPTLLCALESGYLFKKRELIQVLIVAHVEHISSHCVLSPLLYLGLNLRFPQMPRLEFLTDFACLGQFFNVLVEISPEYWCVPSIWSSQYHGDWQFWQNFDKILIKFLPGLSSADISSKQVQQGWTNRGSSFIDHWGTDLSL